MNRIVDWSVVAALLIFFFVCGCKDKEKKNSIPASAAVTKSITEGPASLTLTLQPAELPFTHRAEVTVEAVADKDVTINLANYESGFQEGEHQFEFRLRKLTQKDAEPLPEGRLRWSQRFELEFFLPGEYELPPAALTFVHIATAKDQSSGTREIASAPRELKTEAIKVIAQATEAAQLAPEELKKIEVLPPVELKEPLSRWWLAAIPTGLAVFALVLLLLQRRARQKALVQEYIPADEWARRQIAALVAAELIAKGLVQEFYYRISAIVRGYIERRYGVSAPEMTTEEFLTATAGDFRFAGSSASELQAFLTACDLVKYARQKPATGEWNGLLRTAVQFVERTRETDERTTEQMTAPSATAIGAAT